MNMPRGSSETASQDLARELMRTKRFCIPLFIGVILALALSLFAVWKAVQPSNLVATREFVLLDSEGNRSAWLGSAREGPRMAMFDRDGRVIARLGMDRNGPELLLEHHNGKVYVTSGEDGPVVLMYDGDGNLIWTAPGP